MAPSSVSCSQLCGWSWGGAHIISLFPGLRLDEEQEMRSSLFLFPGLRLDEEWEMASSSVPPFPRPARMAEDTHGAGGGLPS